MLGKEVRDCSLLGLLLSASCSSFTVAGQFSAERRALVADNHVTSVGYLPAVAEQNPSYVHGIHKYSESRWTYLGRALYETRRYQDARRSLELALSMNNDDPMARLYLGLTLRRTGDVSTGVKQLEAGMKGVDDWIVYMNRNRPFSSFLGSDVPHSLQHRPVSGGHDGQRFQARTTLRRCRLDRKVIRRRARQSSRRRATADRARPGP